MLRKIEENRKSYHYLRSLNHATLVDMVHKLQQDNQHHMDLLAKYMLKSQFESKLITLYEND